MNVIDLYPSRVREQPSILPRLDPVVYSDWTEEAPLTRTQTAQFERDGYIALESLLSESEIALLQDEAAKLAADASSLESETAITEPGSDEIRSIFKIHTQNAIFERLACDTRLVSIAQFILGDDVYIHQSRLNFKPGFTGKEFYWHSDFETWHVEDGMPRMRAISMSVLLNENTAVNAPTMFIPGSHQAFIACVGATPEDHYKASLKKQEYGVPAPSILSQFARNHGIAMPTGKAGTVIIFDCNAMHGSNSNITPFPRSNAFLVFNAVSNRPLAPFGPKTPRPEFIAERSRFTPVRPLDGRIAAVAA